MSSGVGACFVHDPLTAFGIENTKIVSPVQQDGELSLVLDNTLAVVLGNMLRTHFQFHFRTRSTSL